MMTVRRMTLPWSDPNGQAEPRHARGEAIQGSFERICRLASSFSPRYTTVWLDYLKKKGISLDVKDVPVHFFMHEPDSVTLSSPLTRLFVFAIFATGMHIPWLNASQLPPIPISLT